MLKRIFSEKIEMSPKLAAGNMAVVAGAFIWYFVAYSFLKDLTLLTLYGSLEQLEVIGANIAAIAVSAVLGTFVVEKYRTWTSFLSYWTLTGVFVSFTPLFLSPPSFGGLVVVSTILGLYFGFGMPATMGYFAASTKAENRATTGGFTFLAIGLGLSLSILLVDFKSTSILTSSIILAGVRLASLLLFLSFKVKEEPREEFGRITYSGIATNRSILLYLIPWIMFNIVDYLTVPSTEALSTRFPQANVDMLAALEQVLIAVFALVTGFLADVKGRKRLAILGFASLGIGYAALGFFPTFPGWVFYTFADGIAWGILDVIFLFTLWGDLARGRNSEKLYVLGALPYLFSNFAYVLLSHRFIFGLTQIFSFAAFFLFIAVLPLFYAHETLPEKIMKKRELTIYVEKAQEIAEKYY